MEEHLKFDPARISLQAVNSPARLRAWSAPLFSAVACWTAGIILDRYLEIPLSFSFLVAAGSLLAWGIMRLGHGDKGNVIYIMLGCAALGAAYHHLRQHSYFANDIGVFASSTPRPVQARGTLDEEPAIVRPVNHPELQSMDREASTSCVLRVHTLKWDDDWVSASGRAQLSVQGELVGLHAGDQIEVSGRLSAPEGPGNPGEFDYQAYLRDQRIRAVIQVAKTVDGVTRLERGSWRAPSAWLGMIRGWGQRTFQTYIPIPYSGLASALLFGESSEMTNDDWEKYIRTAVIHVLAISGQHLVVLAGFLWWTLPLLRVPRRHATWLVTLLLIVYALVAGGRPPVLRSAVTVLIFCIGYYWRRPVMLGNALALAWLCVSVVNPADLATTGCMLSFLSVAALYWCVGRWPRGEQDPLQRLVEKSWPAWKRILNFLIRVFVISYLVTVAIWIADAPLVAARYHLVSPIGILIGPPLTLLTSIALILGFGLLIVALVCPPLAWVFGWLMSQFLSGSELLVDLGGRVPMAYWYVGDVPTWWLWCFYLGLVATLTIEAAFQHWRWALVGGLGWACVGFLVAFVPGVFGRSHTPGLGTPGSGELRCTFLAVGHGGCTVIETPDGRTILYDAGAMAGPEITRRQIAPFLWHRGVRRIDEVLLSHADLDHFNGLPALLERFSVGQVTCTPTFGTKQSRGVQTALLALGNRRIPVRIAQAGDRLHCGVLQFEVLHPPATGPEGNENARSLVLLLNYAGHSFLLTGDLEGPGLERVLALPPPGRNNDGASATLTPNPSPPRARGEGEGAAPLREAFEDGQRSAPHARRSTLRSHAPLATAWGVDVLMAPHHGSQVSNRPELAAWARPRVVVSCEGRPRGPERPPEPYSRLGARFLGTWPHGAITIKVTGQPAVVGGSALVVETFRTGQRFVMGSRRGGTP